MQMDRSFCRNMGTSQSVGSLVFGLMEGDLACETYHDFFLRVARATRSQY